jgi:putative molybdopterin biosynthesis protein
MERLHTTLRAARRAAGLSQAALAEAVGLSRQAYAAIEAGRAVPGTDIALRLASALGTTVEALFALPAARRVEAELAGDANAPGPQRVRLVRIGARLLAWPLRGTGATQHVLPWAEGLAQPAGRHGRVAVDLLAEPPANALVALGCDPALALVAVMLRQRGIELVWAEAGSHAALAALARGEAHLAGCHLRDAASGEFNRPWVARLVPFSCTLVTFAIWQTGLVVAPGNPRALRGAADLARPDVCIVNRGPDSGSRALLDAQLAAAGVPASAIRGYERVLSGHLAVAEAVACGLADAGVATRAAAAAYGLDFVPWAEERYDLVLPNAFLDLPAVGALLDALRRPALRRQVEALGGYDVAPMGTPIGQVG